MHAHFFGHQHGNLLFTLRVRFLSPGKRTLCRSTTGTLHQDKKTHLLAFLNAFRMFYVNIKLSIIQSL